MRVGIIGTGAISRRAHLPSWKSMPDIEVACIADIDEMLLKRVADEFDVKKITTNYREILDDESIDVADVCTPTPNHCEIIIEAIKAGKHIIVEKPLASNINESISIFEEAIKFDRQISIIQNWRYLSSVFKVKEILQKERLGQIISINGRSFNHLPVGWTRNRWLYSSEGVLLDFTPHIIDVVLSLIDDQIESVIAWGKNFTEYAEFLSSAQLMIRFRKGTVAILNTSWEVNYRAVDFHIEGTGGCVALDLRRNLFEESHGAITPLNESRIFARRMGKIAKGILSRTIGIEPILSYRPLFRDYVESISSGSPPPITVEEGVRVNIVLEAAKQSISSGSVININHMLQKLGLSSNKIKKLL